ncbi:MAG: 4-(cytidine 5'-diphospho)-2-C-methyl-D-erythritol kinase, partial [Candidatus Caldatribacteriota bacterium]|nr:4-(cytidine 5'-diphospho)-2-C-methyl-D-erythritol kinase [Candidatus Caldatribacteriota bacterium]
MKEIKINSYSKINLILQVLDKREDGYHNIESIMQSVNLADEVIIRERKEGIRIDCDHHNVPTNLESLAYRTAKDILDKCGTKKGINIKINKNIPLGSGMAGGSTNSAAILAGINKIYNFGLDDEGLRKMGSKLGMDIPFFIQNGTALAYHKGEKVTHFSSIEPPLWLVIINPEFEISTKWAYQNLDLKKDEYNRNNTTDMISSLKTGRPEDIAKYLYNSFEKSIIKNYPEIGKIKERLIREGALGALMSGSGPTVFGIAKNQKEAFKIYKKVKPEYKLAWVVHTI